MNFFIILIFIFSFPITSYSFEGMEDCLRCHNRYRDFDHRGITCLDCHVNIKSFPHETNLKKPSCNSCHSELFSFYKDDIQHKKVRIRCINCHNPHNLGIHKDLSIEERMAVCSYYHKKIGTPDYELIDLIGISLSLIFLGLIITHALLRILVKK